MFQGFLVGMYICYSHQVSTERESHKTISSMDTGTIHLSFDLITDLKCSVHSMIWINCFSWQTGFVFLSRRIIAGVFVASAPLRSVCSTDFQLGNWDNFTLTYNVHLDDDDSIVNRLHDWTTTCAYRCPFPDTRKTFWSVFWF